jgi:hypothetical protein
MVAKITVPRTINRALNYNEKKVERGQATCIHAQNFLKESQQLKFYDKLERFQHLIALNQRATTNTLHISLNFDPTEKLEKEKLTEIANTYMQKIGFGNQPYLVYQHRDAGHPHIHIVTTNIEANGKRINTFNIGKNQSEQARKEIETIFKLVKAEKTNQQKLLQINPIDPQKIQYGKSDTKRAITNVLDKVVNQYKYTSLHELNAILRQYNIMVDKGREGSRVFKHNGLQYKILNEKGKSIGVPIKASSIYSKPTLKNLEKRFTENEEKRQPDKQKLKTAIDWVLHKNPKSIKDFINELRKEKVQVVARENDNGIIYGLTYIDYRTKAVFNGSDLGKGYSAAGIKERLGVERETMGNEQEIVGNKQKAKELQIGGDRNKISQTQNHNKTPENATKTNNDDNTSLLEQLMQAEKLSNRVAYELLKKKRKRNN